jgi:GntR family transcriptional repressor for pyruvate dehydrogenase complex
MTEPLEIRTAAQQVAERLVTAIALGSVAPGQKFPPERELAHRLQVSRVTLRAALHELQEQGYVTILKGRSGGATVASAWQSGSAELVHHALAPRWEQLEWVFDLQRELGQLVARLAAERRSAADLDMIRESVAAYASPEWGGDVHRQVDLAIHSAIAQATHNPYLVSLESQIWGELSLGVGVLPGSPKLHEQAISEHRALAEAISDHDAERAAAINLSHFVDLVETPLRQLFETILENQPVDVLGDTARWRRTEDRAPGAVARGRWEAAHDDLRDRPARERRCRAGRA